MRVKHKRAAGRSVANHLRPRVGLLALARLTVLLGAITVSASAQVVISEFMAKNDKTLADGDGNYSDWVELYNLSSNSVNLTGWHLSDDSNNPVKWTFPSKSIDAGAHLVVFASGQATAGYTDSLGYLHANFKLNASGESVVLARPDGTVEHAFLNYPEQEDDISYGLAQDSSYATLIAEEEDAKAFIGTSQPPSTWNTAGFSDSAWTAGQTGVGFEYVSTRPPRPGEPVTTPVYTNLINLNVIGMRGVTGSAFIRIPFTLDGSENLSQLALRMKYDDGFVAYVNGTQVASANAPTSPTYASYATTAHTGTAYEAFTILNVGDFLQTGDNVLAIHGLNLAGDTNDFFISPLLTGIAVGDLQTNSVMYYSTPTPGADNVFGVLDFVGDTTFSVDRGFFTNAFSVEIACETGDAQIYYTIDGTTPATDNGTLYTGPVAVSKTTILRAAAFKAGWQPSDTDTQTYLFLDDIIAQGTSVSGLAPYFPPSAVNGQKFDYGMDTNITKSSTYSSQIKGALKAIPSISIVTDPDNLFDSSTGIYVNPKQEGEAWERETSIELINPDGTKGFQINGGLRIRGESSSSTSNPKHSFRFIFDSQYGTSRLTYPLFGDEGADSFKRMDLRTGQNFSWAFMNPQYSTWLYDIFTRDTHRDMNQPHTRGEYYHLYINGMYWGLYQTEERCDSRYAESYYGDDSDDFDAVKADGTTGIMYAVDGTRTAYDTLWTNINAGVSANSAYFKIQGKNADGTENGSYTKLLDVDNVIDYMLLIFFTANRDSPIGPPNQNTMPRNLNAIYNRNDPDGFKFVAHDNEHSLEIQQGVNHNRVSFTPGTTFDGVNNFTPWWMHIKLMNNAEYKLRFADHVNEHFFNGGVLTATNAASRLAARTNEIYAAVVAESARWGDSTGTRYTRDGNWLVQANWLLNTYMTQRTAIVYSQIVAKGWYPTVAAPVFNRHGGSITNGLPLTMSGTGTIYYTTDGSDPRAVGGAVAGTTYSSAIPLTRSAQVKARCLTGGVWSALTKATFVLNEASPLRVTEIMYNPAEPISGAETNYAASDFEFIEILNTSSKTVGLAGTKFSKGVYFDFTESDVATLAPGEYAVLVSNYEAFTNRYSNWASIKIAGKYHGKFFIPTAALNNDGENIQLLDGFGNTILDFDYQDWYEATDGEGFSLTLINPYAATNTWSESSAWRPSKYSGGTPGAEPYDFPSPGDLVINEALTHQDNDTPGDWIELFNTSTNTLDINGWFLSDDAGNLARAKLNGVSTIPPGGYLVLTEAAHFGATTAGTNGFALSELGDGVFLSSGEGGVLTGYRTEVTFGAAHRDVTFGRHTKSDGNADFTAQSAATYGSANTYPRVGPVVITELLYRPATNAFEFIELFNTASTNVLLYDPLHPTNTWKLEGGIEFTFPMGLSLAPGQFILITETNATAFTNAYTVPAGITVLGPYDGKLDNAGETVWVTRPGEPEVATGEVPYILEELVDYDNTAPWPTNANTSGVALVRVNTALYANDSANWTSSSNLTPGTAAGVDPDADNDGDGMPDRWEIACFGATNAVNGEAGDDWDADRASNHAECIADTNPTNALSYFHIESIASAPSLTVSYTSSASRVYTLYYRTNLTSGDWTNIPSQTDIPGSGGLDTRTDSSPADTQRFYRLGVSLP